MARDDTMMTPMSETASNSGPKSSQDSREMARKRLKIARSEARFWLCFAFSAKMAQDCLKMARDDTKKTLSKTAWTTGPKNPDSAGNQWKSVEISGNRDPSRRIT